MKLSVALSVIRHVLWSWKCGPAGAHVSTPPSVVQLFASVIPFSWFFNIVPSGPKIVTRNQIL